MRIQWGVMAVLASAMIAVCFFHPDAIADSNVFLSGILTSRFVLVLCITNFLIVDVSNDIYRYLGAMDSTGYSFNRTRRAIRKSTISACVVLAVSSTAIIVKTAFDISAVANSIALLSTYFMVNVLFDLSVAHGMSVTSRLADGSPL